MFVSLVMGLSFGFSPSDLVKYVVDGFGETLGYIGLMVFAATIVAELLAKTGAATTMSRSILKFVGKSRVPVAVGASGFLLAPPVTCNDTAFMILSPAARTLGIAGGYSPILVSLALAAGAYSSFKLVFPAAPLYAAAAFHADLAKLIVLGFLVSIPVFAAGLLWTYAYARYGHYEPPRTQPSLDERQSPVASEVSPSIIESCVTITVPLALILARALADAYLPEVQGIRSAIDFVGHPVIAMLVGVGLALFVARKHPKEEVSKWVGDGLARGATIVAVIGAGGVLGKILIAADLGKLLGSLIAAIGISGAVTIFLVAAVIKTVQGSSVVTMVTAPSIVLPLLPALGVSPTLATLLVSAGAMISVHVNDSYFWVVTGFSQMPVSEGVKSLTVMSLVQGLTAFVMIVVIARVLPTI